MLRYTMVCIKQPNVGFNLTQYNSTYMYCIAQNAGMIVIIIITLNCEDTNKKK